MTGRELSLEDAEDLYRVSTQDFPLCDPDAIGVPIPIAIGDVANAPAIGLVSGIVHKLAADLPITALASIPVSDGALVARMPPSGTLQIDEEQFTYTGRNITAMTFTGITRAAFGTTAVTHARGAPVFQVLSEYVYAFAANPGATHQTSGVPRLRSDGALIAAGTLHHRPQQHDPQGGAAAGGRPVPRPARHHEADRRSRSRTPSPSRTRSRCQDTIAVQDAIAVGGQHPGLDAVAAKNSRCSRTTPLPRDSGSYHAAKRRARAWIILDADVSGAARRRGR